MTAYQALGPFISTFADSNITSLLHNDNGEIVITDRELLAQRLADFELREEEPEQEENNTEETEVKTETLSTDCDETSKENFEQVISMEVEDDETEVAKEQDSEHLRRIVHSKSLNDLSPEEDRAKSYEPSSSSSSATLTSSESFNNFLYWRDPLPVLEDLPSEDPKEAEETSPDSERKGNFFKPIITRIRISYYYY